MTPPIRLRVGTGTSTTFASIVVAQVFIYGLIWPSRCLAVSEWGVGGIQTANESRETTTLEFLRGK